MMRNDRYIVEDSRELETGIEFKLSFNGKEESLYFPFNEMDRLISFCKQCFYDETPYYESMMPPMNTEYVHGKKVLPMFFDEHKKLERI